MIASSLSAAFQYVLKRFCLYAIYVPNGTALPSVTRWRTVPPRILQRAATRSRLPCHQAWPRDSASPSGRLRHAILALRYARPCDSRPALRHARPCGPALPSGRHGHAIPPRLQPCVGAQPSPCMPPCAIARFSAIAFYCMKQALSLPE